MNKVIENGLQSFFDFIGSTVRFFLGLLAVVVVPVLAASAEILDDFTGPAPVDWRHVAKVVIPSVAGAVLLYLYHVRAVAVALATIPPGTFGAPPAGAGGQPGIKP